MSEGKYVREREIGRGGMGAVWLGQDTVLGRRVAMKRVGMVPGGSTPDLERAEREARLAAALNHPHVVAVFDLVAEGDEHWLVMEYVAGPSLAQVIRRDGPMDPTAAAAVMWQVADALTAAHAAGIVHRDVKPSNILLTDDGHARLTDFGIARAEADASLTQTGLVTGSPAYLSPEVASGQSATPASDVWALGATLYHALAGRPPYDVGDNVLGALYQIVHEQPPRLDELGWPAQLLHHTMATAPEERWSIERARDFLRDGRASAVAPATEANARRGATPSVPSEQTTVLPPAPATAPPGTAAGKPAQDPVAETSTPGWVMALAGVAILGLVVFAFFLGLDNPRSGDAPSGSPSPAAVGEGTGSSSPTQSPTSAGTGEQGPPTAQEMEAFVAGYLDTVTSDPRSTWGQLTPAFQEESGGFGQYNSFWRTIADVTLVDVTADPEELTVTYRVRYALKRGGQTTDRVTLQLERDADGFQIADES